MRLFKQYYNLFVLLICVGAFPVAIAASPNLSDESLVCKFHNDQTNNVISCDHCAYFIDLSTSSVNQDIIIVNVPFIINQDKQEFTYQIKSFQYSSRSPPHSYI